MNNIKNKILNRSLFYYLLIPIFIFVLNKIKYFGNEPQYSLGIILVLAFLVMFIVDIRMLYYILFPSIIILPNIVRYLYSITGNINSTNLLSASVDVILIMIYIRIILKNILVEQYYINNRVDKWIIIYVAAIFLCTINSVFTMGIKASIHGTRLILLPTAIYFILSYEKIDVNLLLKTIIISFIIVNIYEIYQQIFGFFNWETLYLKIFKEGGIGTIYFQARESGVEGFYKNLNGYNLSFSISIITVYLTTKLINGKANIADKLMIFTSIILLVLILERTPLFALILSLSIYFLLRGVRENKKYIFLAIITIIVVEFILVKFQDQLLYSYSLKLRRLGEMSNPLQAGTMQGRIYFRWADYLKLINSPNIIFGYGFGFYPNRIEKVYRGFHSLFFNQILELGLLGFISFFISIIYLYKMCDQNRIRYFIPIITFIIIGIPNSPFAVHSKYYFWVFAGLLVRDYKQKVKKYV